MLKLLPNSCFWVKICANVHLRPLSPDAVRALRKIKIKQKIQLKVCNWESTVQLLEPEHMKEDYPITMFFENKRFSTFL